MKNLRPFILLVVALFPGAGALYAQDSFVIQNIKKSLLDTLLTNSNMTAKKDIEIEGMIIDQTQSKWGKDFFELFNSNWIPPEKINSYTISIGEKIIPGLRTQILININGDDIYQNFIRPRYENIVEDAAEAVNIALTYLKNYEEIQAEIQSSDLKGTGIY